MHAAALLAEAVDLARQLDYHIREEDLEGAGGGHCAFGGKKWLLLDVTQSAREQLADALDALRSEARFSPRQASPQLLAAMVQTKAAA
jgi:hypothetical protein